MERVERKQYRGCLKADVHGAAWTTQLQAARQKIRGMIQDGTLLTASLYHWQGMCFLYYEALRPGVCPEAFLDMLTPFLELWPEEEGKTPWARMYHIYHHQVPEDAGSWEQDRGGEKTRIGRIAFVYPDKLFSYTYWHQAIVEEGLLKGDKYQCIALHENILFSYFEEPKTMVNIRREPERESKVIDQWMQADPESHFDREKAGGENFRIIEPLISVGRGEL